MPGREARRDRELSASWMRPPLYERGFYCRKPELRPYLGLNRD